MSKFKFYPIFIGLLMMALSPIGCALKVTSEPPPTPAPVILTINYGAMVKTYSLDQIKALPSTTGAAGTISGAGTINTQVQCKGVALAQLLSGFAGLSASSSIKIEGSDGYFMTLTYSQITQGSFPTFSVTDGTLVSSPGQSTTVLEYEENGVALGSDLGPLRLAFISPQGQVTRSNLWVKSIGTIDILAG